MCVYIYEMRLALVTAVRERALAMTLSTSHSTAQPLPHSLTRLPPLLQRCLRSAALCRR